MARRLLWAAGRVLPIAVLVGAGVFWTALAFTLLTSSGQGFDFAIYFAAALAVRDHASANIFDLAVLRSAALRHHAQVPGDLYMYPPILAILQIPLTVLPYRLARLLWVIENLACWLGCTALLASLLRQSLGPVLARQGLPPLPMRGTPRLFGTAATSSASQGTAPGNTGQYVWAIAVLVSLVYMPFALTLGYGEVNGIILLLILCAPALRRSGRPGLAGVALALAAAIKLFPLLLVGYYLLRGDWRVVRGVAVASMLIVMFMAVVVGPSALADTRFVLTNGGDHVLRACNEALTRVPYWIARLIGSTPGPAAALIGYALAGTVGLVFVTTLALAARDRMRLRAARVAPHVGPRDDTHELVGYGWALCTMVLVSPVTWEHHDVWLLPALLICIGASIQRLAALDSLRGTAAHVPWLGLIAGTLGYVLTMENLPFGFDLSLNPASGPYLVGVPLHPFFMLVRPFATGLVWLALGLLFVRPTAAPKEYGVGATEQTPPAYPAEGSVATVTSMRAVALRQRDILAMGWLLMATLASLIAGILLVAGTYTLVAALAR